MTENRTIREFLRDNWIVLLIAVQPILDFVAYWTQSPDGTVAGYIRLAFMVILPVYLLLTMKNKMKLLIPLAVIGAACCLHIANSYFHGFINAKFDIAYMAKLAYLPVLVICLTHLIRDEKAKTQVFQGVLIAAVITGASIVIAWLTGTANDTYGPGLGISGWVIDENRCANSAILVCLAAFAVWYSVKSDKKLVNICVPVTVAFTLISNGTKACYFSVFALFIGYAVFCVFEKIAFGRALKKTVVFTLVIAAVISAAVYPVTPRYKVNAMESASGKVQEGELERKLREMGYDLYALSAEERLSIPEVREQFEEYYYKMIYSVVPDMFHRFGVERIMLAYDVTADASTLDDVRRMKLTYAKLIWDECDAVTKIVGFEPADVFMNTSIDLENDWPAVFYYCGYLGFGLYAMFVLRFAWLIIRRMAKGFESLVNKDNFLLLMGYAIMVGLAQFSGSVIRRPNVAIYLVLIMVLIYYETAVKPVPEN